MIRVKMFGFVKKIFLMESLLYSSLVSTTQSSCISMNNQAHKVRPEIVNVNSNEPLFYAFSFEKVNVMVVVIILTIRMQKYVLLMI